MVCCPAPSPGVSCGLAWQAHLGSPWRCLSYPFSCLLTSCFLLKTLCTQGVHHNYYFCPGYQFCYLAYPNLIFSILWPGQSHPMNTVGLAPRGFTPPNTPNNCLCSLAAFHTNPLSKLWDPAVPCGAFLLMSAAATSFWDCLLFPVPCSISAQHPCTSPAQCWLPAPHHCPCWGIQTSLAIAQLDLTICHLLSFWCFKKFLFGLCKNACYILTTKFFNN